MSISANNQGSQATRSRRDTSSIERELLEVRKEFALTFKIVTFVVLAMVVSAVLAMLAALIVLKREPAAMGLTAALIQVGLAMILGFGCVFFGVILSWLGITSAFQSKIKGASFSIGLQAAGPGISLILGGMILVGAALYRNVSYGDAPYRSGPRYETEPGDGGDGAPSQNKSTGQIPAV